MNSARQDYCYNNAPSYDQGHSISYIVNIFTIKKCTIIESIIKNVLAKVWRERSYSRHYGQAELTRMQVFVLRHHGSQDFCKYGFLAHIDILLNIYVEVRSPNKY